MFDNCGIPGTYDLEQLKSSKDSMLINVVFLISRPENRDVEICSARVQMFWLEVTINHAIDFVLDVDRSIVSVIKQKML
jgi:hypothetical protein